jgi:hypothetical protein
VIAWLLKQLALIDTQEIMFHQFPLQWKDQGARSEILSVSLGESNNRHENTTT